MKVRDTGPEVISFHKPAPRREAYERLASALEEAGAAIRVLAEGEPEGPTTSGPDCDLPITVAAQRLGLGLSTVYELAEKGKLRVVRHGRAVRVPERELEAYRRRHTQ